MTYRTIFIRCMVILFVIVAVAAVVALWVPLARAHGSASWIMAGPNWRCCGEKDCKQLPDGDVVPTPMGWFIKSRGEFVAFKDEKRSKDHHFWLCVDMEAKTERKPLKCLFVPAPGV